MLEWIARWWGKADAQPSAAPKRRQALDMSDLGLSAPSATAASPVPIVEQDKVSDLGDQSESVSHGEGDSEAEQTFRSKVALELDWMSREGTHAAFLNWAFGQADHGLFLNEHENRILEQLESQIKAGETGTRLVRRMPGVLPQLLQRLRHDDFSGTELARKISNDPVLVEAVLRIANSSLHHVSAQPAISSIEHAVLVLGQTGLRQLITSVAFRPILDLKSGRYTRLAAVPLWRQSELCASACKQIGHLFQLDAFDSFLCGLAQNVGLIVALHTIDLQDDGEMTLGSEAFLCKLAAIGRTMSALIVREWNFSNAICVAIEEQNQIRLDSGSNLTLVLSLGDHLSKMHMLSQTNDANVTERLDVIPQHSVLSDIYQSLELTH